MTSDIDWPAQFGRTPPADRGRTSKFGVTFHKTLEHIERELLDRVGADDWRVSTAASHRKKDSLPYADANLSDPAVVIRWSKDGQQFAVACDHYTDWRDNARAIGLYIREKWKMSDRPVTTGQSEFATARLPSGNEEAIVADAPADQPEPHEVLDVAPDASADVVEAAYRKKTKTAHPDQAGSAEELKRVRQAKEAMLNGNGGPL